MSVPFLADPRREITVPLPTHPAQPGDADDAPRGVIATLPPDSRFGRPTRPMPFSPPEPRIPRGAWWGLVAGVEAFGLVPGTRIEPHAVQSPVVELQEIARAADEARAPLHPQQPQLIQPRLDIDHVSRKARRRPGRSRAGI